MRSTSGLTTGEILSVFTEEVAAQGGRVSDTFNDGRRLFARSILSRVEEIRPRDGVQGGVAVKATEEEVWIYPYFFRLVCRNGTIIAQTLGSRSVTDLPLQEPESARQVIREGIVACCAEEVFSEAVWNMRSASQAPIDVGIALLPLGSRLSGPGHIGMLSQIMDQFFRDRDQTRFGLMNAITAVARDTKDPSLRWDLEEFGGAVAIDQVPSRPLVPERLVTAS